MKNSNQERKGIAKQARRLANLAQELTDALAKVVAEHGEISLTSDEVVRAVQGMKAAKTVAAEDIRYLPEIIRAVFEKLAEERRLVTLRRRSDGRLMLRHPYVAMGLFGGEE